VKKLYSNDKCRRHPTRVVAICPACYDAALRQQEHQWVAERKVEHEKYLERRAA
jgi:hypothetical protein